MRLTSIKKKSGIYTGLTGKRCNVVLLLEHHLNFLPLPLVDKPT